MTQRTGLDAVGALTAPLFAHFAPCRGFLYTNASVIDRNLQVITDEAKKYGYHYW